MKIANENFKVYCELTLTGACLDEYMISRKTLTSVILKNENTKWHKTINGKNSKELWKCIDWKGNLNNKRVKVHPSINELRLHSRIYKQQKAQLEKTKIEELKSGVYIPLLDDPIDEREVTEALDDCKKGGYDFNLVIFRKIVSNLLPLIIIIFNCLFHLLKISMFIIIFNPEKKQLESTQYFARYTDADNFRSSV